MIITNQSQVEQAKSAQANLTSCDNKLTELDAFLYGLPGGLILAGCLYICFVFFGQAITGYRAQRAQPSASSVTRADKQNFLGKRHKRGPPPSTELKPVDIHKIALQEDAPDDVRAVALAGRLLKQPKSGSRSK